MSKLKQEFKFNTVQSGTAIIKIDDDKISIKRKGILAFNKHGLKGEKTFFINQITAIQLKEASLTIGYIQFVLNGSLESKSGVMSAMSDENTVCFSGKKQNEDALKIKKYIELLQQQNNSNKNTTKQCDSYDKIYKLKKLLDDGAITQEEYDKEKAKLLK